LKRTVGKLSILTGPGAGSFFFLFKKRYVLGRDEESPIGIYEKSVSKTHCQIFRSGEKYFLTDLNSTNGTFLNGERLRPNQHYEITPNSHIHLGNAELFFSIDTIELDTQDKAEKSKVPTPSTDERDGLFTGDSLDKETTAEINTEALARGKRVSSTIPFNMFSSRNLAAIYRILGAVGSTNDRRYLIEKSLDVVTEILRAERGFLFLTDDIKEWKVRPAAARNKKGKVEVSSSDANAPMINRVTREGVSVLSSGVPDELGIPGSANLAEGAVVSALCVPLQSRERVFGVIYVDATAGIRDFEKEDVELLTAIGIHLGALMENIELSLRNQELFIGVIRTLVYIIEAKDKYTLGHSERVTRISLAVADEIGIDQKEREALRVAGLIHDIGKVIVPGEILNKPDGLTREEYSIIKKHPVIGYNFVEHLAGFKEVRNGILSHHERFDGKGYPNGLKGENIPFIARIIAAADAFDAMTSDRPYRKSFSEEHAIEELLANKGTQFDAQVIDAFIQAYVSGNINLEMEKPVSFPENE